MSFPDRAALARELTENLSLGRAFVQTSCEAPILSACRLVLVHPDDGRELTLTAQIVMLNESGPMRGVGLALTQLGAELKQLSEFASTSPPSAAMSGASDQAEPATSPEPSAADTDASHLEPQPNDAQAASEDAQPEPAASSSAPPPTRSSRPSLASDLQLENRQERLRGLNAAEQVKLARTGELADRIAIERLYGKQVWDALLHNPRISLPEVARIARKGTVPKPLLEIILDNASWIKADAVRRALLSNPKLGSDAVLKLLRATPKHELKLIEKGTAYAAAIRESARKLLRQ